jgi:hypothetical protein
LPGQWGQEIIYEWEVYKIKDDRSLLDEEYKIQVCASGKKIVLLARIPLELLSKQIPIHNP